MNLGAGTIHSWTTICCRRQEGPWNGCVGQAWFMIECSLKPSQFCAWVLFDFSGLCLLREWKKEKYRERDGIWEKMKERKKKKKCSEIEREETLPSKTNTFLPHTILGCSYSGVAVERKTIFETKFYLLSLCGYMVKKEPHHTTFFLFFVKATQWITFGLWILGSLLQTII